MIDVHYASLTSQGVQHRVFYLHGHPSRYQPRPTGLDCGEQTGTDVFPLVIAVQSKVVQNKGDSRQVESLVLTFPIAGLLRFRVASSQKT